MHSVCMMHVGTDAKCRGQANFAQCTFKFDCRCKIFIYYYSYDIAIIQTNPQNRPKKPKQNKTQKIKLNYIIQKY